MKVREWISHLRDRFPLAEVSLERWGNRPNFIIVVTARRDGEWQEFLYRIGSEEAEVGEQSEGYEKEIEAWYNKRGGEDEQRRSSRTDGDSWS